MTNKYQEALDRLRVDCNGRYDENGNSIPALSQKDGNDSLDTLQELVDKYGAMYEDMIEDAKFLKEVVEPNLKVLKETYKSKPVTILETPDRLEDNLVSNVIFNGEPLVNSSKDLSIPKDSKVEIIHFTEFELQKALDKACELLSESDCVFPGDYPWAEKEQWKEWLLKDEDTKEL